MKKHLWISVVVLAIAVILTSCANSAKITDEEARNIALQEAGVTADEVQGLTARLERDDGRTYYEVEFYANAVEYDVEIDATTGIILKFDRDGNEVLPTVAPTETTSAPLETLAALTAEQAQQIALEDSGFSADQVRRLTVRLDHDNGTKHYDVEFFNNGTKYDYEIDAQSGSILSVDRDIATLD